MRKKNQAFVDPHSQATSTCMGFIWKRGKFYKSFRWENYSMENF
jgi:hypothetical protein